MARQRIENTGTETAPALEKEDSAARARRLSAKRLGEVQKRMQLLGNLGNARQYPMSQERMAYILKALENSYVLLVARLTGGKVAANGDGLPE